MLKKTHLSIMLLLACAGMALGQVADKTAKKLMAQLEHRDAGRRIEAADLLGKIKAEAAVPGLTEALEDPVWGVRSAAARALWRLGSPESVAGLRAATKDRSKAVRSAAQDALDALEP